MFIPVSILSFGWYLAAYHVGGQAFLDKVFDENVHRFLEDPDEAPHGKSAPVFWLVFLAGNLPWSLIAVPAAIFLYRKDRNIGVSFSKGSPFEKFSLVSIFSFLIFYSIPGSKRGVYLLPAYPFFAFVMARILVHAEASNKFVCKALCIFRYFIFSLSIALLLFLIFPVELSQLSFFKSENILFILNNLPSEVLNGPLFVWILPGIFAGYLLWATIKRKDTVISFATLLILFYVSVQSTIVTSFDNILSPRAFAVELLSKYAPETPVYSYLNEQFSLSFYMKRKIHRFTPEKKDLKGVYIIFKDKFQETSAALGHPLKIELESKNCIEKPLKTLIAARVESGT